MSVANPQQGLQASAKMLFDTKDYADATIRCGLSTFKIHKVIVCTRSKYFQRAFDGPFPEALSQEISIESESPETIHQCLEFLYLGDYTTHNGADPSAHARLYAAGDKYSIPGLLPHAIKSFNTSMAELLTFRADMSKGAEAEIQTVMEAIEKAVQQVYETSTPSADSLRKNLVQQIRKALPHLLKQTRFLALLQTVDGLVADLLTAQLNIEPVLPDPGRCMNYLCGSLQTMDWLPGCGRCGQIARNSPPLKWRGWSKD